MVCEHWVTAHERIISLYIYTVSYIYHVMLCYDMIWYDNIYNIYMLLLHLSPTESTCTFMQHTLSCNIHVSMCIQRRLFMPKETCALLLLGCRSVMICTRILMNMYIYICFEHFFLPGSALFGDGASAAIAPCCLGLLGTGSHWKHCNKAIAYERVTLW